MRAWSVESTFFVQAVGERLGMSGTDFCCLTVLLLEGPLGAGTLAARSGLTTGAITGMIDRLERGGWVRRVADPGDRRRVIVEPVADRLAEMRPLLAPMLSASAELRSPLSERDLGVIERFVQTSTTMLGRQIERLRASGEPPAPPEAGGPRDVPMPPGLDGQADLELVGLAAQLTIRAEPIGADLLCRLDWRSEPPELSVRGSHLIVSRRRGRWYRGSSAGTIVVNQDLAWAVDIRGGASNLDLDLTTGTVRSLNVQGGASSLRAALPAPDRPVGITIRGGASKLRISRPSGVAVSVTVRGGASRVVVDGQRVGRFGGGATFSTTSPGGAPDAGGGVAVGPGRYEIDIRGGASDIAIEAR